MVVLGIDPGTAITGYGIVEENGSGVLSAIRYGVITTPSKLSMPERLKLLYNELRDLLDLHRVDSCAVEKLFFSKNVKTAISVGQARGVILLALAEAGLQISEYTPNEVKQSVVGYGSADKNQVQNMVKALLSMDTLPKPDDAADALAVAICHIHSDRLNQLLSS